jgi:hypothetical protein
MTRHHYPHGNTFSRRSFLVASGVGFAGLTFGTPRLQASVADIPVRSTPARSTILFFLCGGASHIDTWDLKPDAPEEFRGPFQPIATSAAGVQISEHLPLLSRQAHHLAIVRSLGHYGRGTGDHHAGYYYNLTGHAPDQTFRTQGNNRRPYPDDWPYMGCVVSARRPPHSQLPSAITLPHKPSRPPYTRPGQFAARLGVEHDPLYVNGSLAQPLEFQAPALTLQAGVDLSRLNSRQSLLGALDQARAEFDQFATVQTYGQQQQRAFSLLASSQSASAFDVGREPLALRERYGQTVNGMSLLLARRLVEIGIPFITVFWMENPAQASRCRSAGGWDTHGNNFSCLREHLLPEFDRGYSSLLEDLSQRGLLEQTLCLVTSEMGRKPRIGDPRSGGVTGAGRDHWTNCMSVVMAGGGIRGGRAYGSSDPRAEYPSQFPVAPEDITKTVYHAMGIRDLEALDPQGRPYNLMAEGSPILDLF